MLYLGKPLKMKCRFFLIVFPILIMGFFSYGQNTLSRISVEGNKFVDTSGKQLVFRGLNASDPDKLKHDGHWNKAYFEAMKSWGANIVRFPVHPSRLRTRGHEAYYKLLDQGIAWATELGLYVIIDWHSIGNLKTGLFHHEMYDTDLKETFTFWKTMSQRYGNNTTVAFFELFNEPTLYENKFGLCSWEEWKAIMEELIVVVRANGAQAIPLVAGFNWAYDLTPLKENPINAEGIGYVSHPYPQKREQPWEPQWTEDWGFAAEKYPLILTEIGFCSADAPGAHIPVIGDETYGDAITNYTNSRGISYVAWVFDPNWSPMLISDWNFTPTQHGTYFKKSFEANKSN